tara:strand:+ start:339 stop:623 length:285 start_codon:yes stop_codon:yes gene_type:complete
MALTDRSNRKISNEHPKYTMFDKYKSDKKSLIGSSGVADTLKSSNTDTTNPAVNLQTAKELSMNPTLTEQELVNLKKSVKEKNKIESTGQFKKV